ncbi:MAG: hypothetical protein GWN55_17340 [Phycisphaerae bacterium]|nr:hypothetical protein [Gammaproteobacteria bacterium]NIR53196.1 hypothetical protein [candidate division KSB1 bacterium]NIV03055.1 hypothetical protein [Phycisphaerae bacterium]NIQ12770.1 hypothetical protein [Gammaproteobacteria bacterium]NIU29161.1 hypothetical protein [candidate division KSB1 bacterium]
MYEALKDITCFVTGIVCFMYGTRIAWGFGKKSLFAEKHDHRALVLLESIPTAAILYFVGFLVVFRHVFDDFITVLASSLTCAILLALMVVATSMPELKRRGHNDGVVVELEDGAICRLAKQTFDYYLSCGKISRFKRSSGWVVVGEDRLRKENGDTVYVGVERREVV